MTNAIVKITNALLQCIVCHVLLAIVIQQAWYHTNPSSAVLPTMNAVYLRDQVHYKYIKLLLFTFKGIMYKSSDQHAPTCTSHGGIY